MPKKPRKTHWTCVRSVRGGAAPDCRKKLEAGPDDFKALSRAGWRQVSGPGSRRLLFECPCCYRHAWAKRTPPPRYGDTGRVVVIDGQYRGRRGTVIEPASALDHMTVDLDGFGRIPIKKTNLRAMDLVERIGELEHRLGEVERRG